MPGRKPHTKSKTGCYSCKKRRVKCEVSSSALPRSNPPSKTNTIELELWHKWTLGTYRHFTNDKPNGSCDTWQILVPKLALECDYLRNAILAISAIHIVLESSTPSQPGTSPYMLAALEYHNAACQAFRDVKSPAINQNESGEGTHFTTVYAFSVITVAFTLELSQCHELLDQTTGIGTSVLGNITMLFGLMQGFGSVILSNILEFSKGPLPINLDSFSDFRRQELNENTKVALQRLQLIIDQAREFQDDHEVNEANSEALVWLKMCFSFYSEDNRDVILIWPIATGPKFTQAIERGEDDVPRLMLLHWAVLLHRFGDGTRFSRRLGSKLAEELCRSVPRKNALWKESVQWVQQQVGLL
ncbi:hypothetical protein H2200_004798 [Cladophialophora chaetospira]|uniref:Zn(2)-C6 fungal-type domain-containing protein n=1 Tax=Cladophialophora chaetospira TaxID=386627 RepID=A0AA39CKS9_9EURO|nr:hypothetical protein H2200_004798 [Cladophialophora chaetospira]